MLQEVKASEGTKVSRKIMYDLNQRLKMKGKDLSIEKQRVCFVVVITHVIGDTGNKHYNLTTITIVFNVSGQAN